MYGSVDQSRCGGLIKRDVSDVFRCDLATAQPRGNPSAIVVMNHVFLIIAECLTPVNRCSRDIRDYEAVTV